LDELIFVTEADLEVKCSTTAKLLT